MYAELGSQVHPAAVIPPSNDDNVVRYASLIQVQSTATDPAGISTLDQHSSHGYLVTTYILCWQTHFTWYCCLCVS